MSAIQSDTLEIINQRRLTFRRDLVFRAYAEPELLTTWWGPRGFRSTFHQFDFREGGSWRFTLHGPDDTDYENEKTIVEIVPDERIVYQHHGDVHSFVMSVTLKSDNDDMTSLEWRLAFPNDAHHQSIRSFIENANEENLDRLEACLTRMRA
jgi:uncharacterized protein YndB with AHSA1/START domain